MKRLVILFLFIILFLLAIIPRVTEVVNKNPIFLLDQGRDYVEVKKIVEGKLTLIGSEIGGGMAGFQGIFQGPFHFYFLSIPFLIFGGDPYGGVVLMFVFGLATIATSFLFGKKLFKSAIWGLILALLAAMSPPIISQSRFVWNPHPSSLFIVLSFYFIYMIHKNNRRDIFLAGFFTAFIYNFEIAMAAPMSIALLLYCIFIVKFRKISQYLFLFIGFIAGYLPFILFEIRHGFLASNGIINYLFSRHVNLSSGKNIPVISNHIDSFIYNFSDSFPKQNLIPLNLLLAVFIIGLFVFYLKEKNKSIKKFLIYLFFVLIVTFLVLAFLHNHIFMYYLIHLNFIYFFLFTYLLYVSYKEHHEYFKVIFILIFLVMIYYAISSGFNTFEYDLHDYGGTAKIKGRVNAIDYIYQDAKGKPFGLMVFTPPVYTYPYDYLVEWYGRNNYHYYPNKDKKGTFYLLIDVDPDKPWSYRGWLETVIKTGQVVFTKTLPSGFIVQKRVNGL